MQPMPVRAGRWLMVKTTNGGEYQQTAIAGWSTEMNA